MSNYLIDKLGGNSDSIYTVINLLGMNSKNLPRNFEGFNPHSSIEQIIDAGIF
jgi:hypothetical protein